ncbi:MAG: hypothetical protein WC668_03640 [Patescibacteria group bacterium]|jgi:hypothetical protein
MSQAMDKKVNIGMFFKAMGSRLQGLLASALSPEEKLTQIIAELEKQVQEKRILARQIGAQMRAIADPETKELEPLEALQVRRIKLVGLGGSLVDQPDKTAQLGQVSQEVKSLDDAIASQKVTYGTLEESYKLARANYNEALSGLNTIRQNGPAMLKAIEAHKQAVAMRDRARAQGGAKVDTAFLGELQGELVAAQAEFRSDGDIDRDLDASSGFNVDAALAQLDAQDIDAGLMAEFQAAKAN